MTKKTKDSDPLYLIKIRLAEGHRAEFVTTDLELAQRYYDQWRAQGVLLGTVIKHIEFDKQ